MPACLAVPGFRKDVAQQRPDMQPIFRAITIMLHIKCVMMQWDDCSLQSRAMDRVPQRRGSQPY